MSNYGDSLITSCAPSGGTPRLKGSMQTTAVIFRDVRRLDVADVSLDPPTADDVVVDVHFSGISTGTERLLWSGEMPPFPGMGYPLVPGYETVGTIIEAHATSGHREGDTVFVPGANCYGPIRGLFGGSAKRIVAKGRRVVAIPAKLRERGVLIALAATAHHALAKPGAALPDLIIGHGVLGRLLARLTLALGGEPPTVWENLGARRAGCGPYPVTTADADPRRDYRAIYDASGDADIFDTLVARLAKGGEIVLAGFYAGRPNFAFAPAFMREATFRIAAEWQPADLEAVTGLLADGRLTLDGLVTDTWPAGTAPAAYDRAFGDPRCLKMVLDWSGCA
jgi:3-hydroxyethyl bacteriochlorophyllide a dehydrogenase